MTPGRGGGDEAQGSAPRLTPEALAEAFVANGRALWCIASAILGNRTQAEDVLQEAVMIALSKIDQFDARTSFVAWMGQIVRFEALNQARRRRRSPVADVEPIALAAIASTPGGRRPAPTDSSGSLMRDQTSFDDDVTRALGTLDETARACILLRTVEGMPYRDISRVLDIPEGTAMSHVHRARAALRDRLRPKGPVPSPCEEGSG